jgi:predicted phage replisome organizer
VPIVFKEKIMAEQKKFYWLKLKKDFFKRHDIQIIESMPNGKDYVLFYLKLMCESIDHEGNLRFSDTIPYNEQMLSTITNTNIDVVRSALKLLQELNMIEILDDHTIYMNEVDKLIGSAVDNDNANRQRRFRERQKENLLAERYESVTKDNESKSIDIEKDKELDKKKKREKKIQEFSDVVLRIFNHWKSKEIYPREDLTEKKAKAIQGALKNYNEEEIIGAIDRYSTVIFDKSYFFNTKWYIDTFMTQGNCLPNFTENGERWLQYLDKTKKATAESKSENATVKTYFTPDLENILFGDDKEKQE